MSKRKAGSNRPLSSVVPPLWVSLGAVLSWGLAAASGQEVGQGTLYKLSLPGRNWALVLNLAGLEVVRDQISADGQARRLTAEGRDRGMAVTVTLGPALGSVDSQALRDSMADRLRQHTVVRKDHFKVWEYQPHKRDQDPGTAAGVVRRSIGTPLPVLEYLIEEFAGVPLRQKHLNAYIVRHGVWIDIHFSKTLVKPGEERLFYSILDSVRFVHGATAQTSFDYFRSGSLFYRQGNYPKAIEAYQKALDLEKREPMLDQTTWRVLVDNLGMAYGISGDLKNAKGVFEYGLANDPTYPMFHYNMACTYAEMGDLERAIGYLRNAFAHKENMIAGERMPDPASDSSFARFLGSDRFRRVLGEIMR